jgi:hypothetical protein
MFVQLIKIVFIHNLTGKKGVQKAKIEDGGNRKLYRG